MNRKPRYKVDLTAHISDCELNYLRIRKLMPDMAEVDSLAFGLSGGGLSGGRLDIEVLERARYTTTLALSQQPCAGLPPAPRLQVRVYHDANVAEVIGWEQERRVQPRYVYPNDKMHQSDEKRQWNRFLAEWLQHCLDCGHSLLNPTELIEM